MKSAIHLKSFGLLSVLTVLSLAGCISEYHQVGVSDTAGILVVDGLIIDNGQTVIHLSRTIKVEDQFKKEAVYVQNAQIRLIDESNNTVAVAGPQIADGDPVPGTYVINDGISFNAGMKYALDIRIGNSHYQSDFVSPVNTPEIDEVTWSINKDKSMDIMVSTHDPSNRTKYFFWRFEEVWEYKTALVAFYRYDPVTKTVLDQDLAGDNRHYCWNYDYSKSLLYGSSDRLSETIVKDTKIHNIPANDSRFCYLYSILVKQYGIDKEAYAYFENLQRNIDKSASLFAPQPAEKEGNIQCLSNPDEPVIGYIAIAKEVTYRLFIDMAKLNLFRYEHICNTVQVPDGPETGKYVPSRSFRNMAEAHRAGFGIYEVLGPSMYWCFSNRCVDCTVREGTKNKPDFWPNDHR
jgi:hypothetical protein